MKNLIPEIDLRFGDYQIRTTKWITYEEPSFQVFPFALDEGYPEIYFVWKNLMIRNVVIPF